jgi:hypothetical protein
MQNTHGSSAKIPASRGILMRAWSALRVETKGMDAMPEATKTYHCSAYRLADEHHEEVSRLETEAFWRFAQALQHNIATDTKDARHE